MQKTKQNKTVSIPKTMVRMERNRARKRGKIWRRKQEYWLVSPFFSIVMFSENEREGMQEREYLPIFVFIYFYSSKLIFCASFSSIFPFCLLNTYYKSWLLLIYCRKDRTAVTKGCFHLCFFARFTEGRMDVFSYFFFFTRENHFRQMLALRVSIRFYEYIKCNRERVAARSLV